jgi:diguanylate cyclase (GGDEF)-like protein
MDNKNCELLFAYLKNILYGPRTASLDIDQLDEPYHELGRDLQYLHHAVEELLSYSSELSKGNLSVAFPDKHNFLCENLNQLHENLNHLTWQAQQVAKGDYSQHISYLGEFSTAFNDMTVQLKQREEQLKEDTSRAKSHAEMIEDYNELLVAMLSKRNEWLIVVDIDTKEILYCNKDGHCDPIDSSFCATCKKRLPFQDDILNWNKRDEYKVWEINDCDTYYRVTSFPIEWKERYSYVHIAVDITDEKRMAHTLTSKAYHDAGTGIKNRLFFKEYMEKILNEQRDATLCYLDLDGLKYVNDTFGHSQGDAYIQNFVELIRSCFRNGDTFARIGGDEFCLVLTGRMKDLIDKKLAAILDSFQSESDSEYQCSFSYGTVEIAGKDNELTLDEIIQKADSIMYKCKRKNKVKYPELIR